MIELRCPFCRKLIGKLSAENGAIFQGKCPRTVCGESFTLTVGLGQKQADA